MNEELVVNVKLFLTDISEDQCTSPDRDWEFLPRVQISAELGGHTFRTALPGRRCTQCGAVTPELASLASFERLIVRDVARRGPRTQETARFLRDFSHISKKEFKELLDLEPDEDPDTDILPPSAGNWEVLAQITLEKLSLSTSPTLERLRMSRRLETRPPVLPNNDPRVRYLDPRPQDPDLKSP